MTPFPMQHSYQSLVQPTLTDPNMYMQQQALMQQQAMLQQHALMQQASLYGQSMLGSPSMLGHGMYPSMYGGPQSPVPMHVPMHMHGVNGSAVHLSPDGQPRDQQQASRPVSGHRSRPTSGHMTRPSSGNMHREVSRGRRVQSASQRRPQQGDGNRQSRPVSSTGVRRPSPSQLMQEQRQTNPRSMGGGFDDHPAVRMVASSPYQTPQREFIPMHAYTGSTDTLPVEQAEEEI
jgi:hypothetical protein